MQTQKTLDELSATANESISAIELINMKKELQAKIETLQNEIEMIQDGFVKNKTNGFIFPGVDFNKINKAMLNRKR